MRRRHGLTQRGLTERLHAVSGNRGVTREDVSRWERGKRIPGPYWRHWLSDVLEVPRAELERAATAARRSRRLHRDGPSPTARR
ncbi:helix-turn-helix transcriptional regulator [Saccharothrix coeruleofusca]|uniref:helix-turn-helix transcriptional regulator n=1 Tax=Saccharothrix coeruleofusca TaxID=33919 RepID=UPI001E3BD3D5|nr:helix-turn-helix transcriptional regulator [Saccharothrix coeruleofusca]